MRPPFEWLVRRLRTLRRPGAAELTFVGVALACVLLPQWWALNRSREQRKQELRAALLTTLETTTQALRSWQTERVSSAHRIAAEDDVRAAAAALAEGDGSGAEELRRALTAAQLALTDRNVSMAGYALLDEANTVIAADRPRELGRTFELPGPAQSEPERVVRWPGDADGLELGALARIPLGEDGARVGRLLIRFDALPALEMVLASRTLGETGRTVLFDPTRVWISQGSAGNSVDCDVHPARMIQGAGSQAPDATRSPFQAGLDVEGLPGCGGRATLAAWDSAGVPDLAILTEISAEEAYRSHAATRFTFVLLGIALGACFLVFVLIQTSTGEGTEARRVSPRRNLAAWGILAVALMATAIGWLSARSRLEQSERMQFEDSAENVRARFAERLLRYESAVRATAASYQPLSVTGGGDLRGFAQQLNLAAEYPALQCMALLRVEAGAELSELSCRQRLLGDGACGLCEAGRGVAADAALFAYDGELVLSTLRNGDATSRHAELVLLQATGGRRQPILGASIDMQAFVRDLSVASDGVDLDVVVELQGGEPVPVLRSSSSDGEALTREAAGVSKSFSFELGDRQIRLLLRPAPRLTPPISQNYPAQVLLAGLAISVLLFDIALVLSSTRERALSIAELMTRRYRDSEVRIRAVIDNAPDGILAFDSVGVVQTFNPGAETLFGYSQDEVSEIRIQDLLPVCIPGVVSQLAESSPDGGAACEGRRKDGTMFPAELTISRMEMADRLLYTAIVRDVSARREAEEKLRESEERYALAARGANDGLWDWDLRKNEVHYSERWKAMLGAEDTEVSTSPDEWLGRVHSEDVVSLRAQLADHLEGRVAHFECEYRIRHSTGGYRWVLTRGIAVRDQQGRATRIAGSQSDITERKRAERQLLYDALHDPLTGLPNRSYFMNRVDQAREEAARSSRRLFGVLFLDIDRFKIVNDSLGHHVGDQLLIAVAERFKSCLRPGDTICRLGGDEFAILVENLAGVADATQIAERIQRELEAPVLVEEREMYAAVSIGIALSSTGRQTAEELVRDADIAMYRAKSRGKARYELFTQRMHTKAVELLQIETDLRQAIENNQIVLHYQPIIDLHEERIHAVEALMRWNHPSRGIVPPGDFIHIAEESGAILRMTKWLLDDACSRAKAWVRSGPATCSSR